MNNGMLKKLISQIFPDITAIRRTLHMHPELSFEEYNTSRLIQKYLKKLDIPYKVLAKTGVVGTLMIDNSFPTICLRAEMDGLPIQDQKNCEYASKNPGIMHACGHDGNMAIALGVACILSQLRDQLKCNIKFLFEPAEEIGKGAKALIAEGALKSPTVEKIIIFHLGNSAPIGMEIQRGISTATTGTLKLKINGKSSHWALKSKGIDAIHAAAKVIQTIKDIDQNYQSQMPFVIGISTINGGTKNNIIAHRVEMSGPLRTFGEEEHTKIFKHLKAMLKLIEEETNSTIEVTLIPGIPSIYNDQELVELAGRIGKGVFGESRVNITNIPFLAGDNAAYYFKDVRGVRLVFFAGFDDRENYPLHSPGFDFNEHVIPLALEVLCSLILSM